LEQGINQKIEAGRFQQHQGHLVRLLDYDPTAVLGFHWLSRLLEARRKAFAQFCISHRAQALLRYLQKHPHRDYSFVIKEALAEINIS
jgi:hypothetical protein